VAKYAPDVRGDNTNGTPQDGVYSSASVGRRNKRGMRYANDASKTPRTLSKQERKSQLRMRMR
jgi:hypothetical protein